ncbi:hypothetical protein [Thiobacter aerophilum]|uniref:Glycosyl transferase family 28 C-terminal domain-containing protein n=1 Tax=Thiobacter aerophilum TaxID=3121275 RepID=A0ABV0EFS4_9BURK
MHLYVDISGHGLGHLAQTAPVLDALAARLPQLRLTLRCALPRERIARRLATPFTHLASGSDFGLVMKNALDVDVSASLAAYRALHRDWGQRVELEAEALARHAPHLVLSNVSYLALAAAKRVGIPALAMSSLNWAAIGSAYLRDEPGFAAIHAEMLAAYQGAQAFLRLTPGMDMPELDNLVPIGPVAKPGRRARDTLPDGRLVLVAMGGIPVSLAVPWPRLPGVRWLMPRASGMKRCDVSFIEDTSLTVSDLIASVDVVLTKAGYGTFVEAAASGTPVLYVQRPDWPEEAALTAWQRRVSRCRAVTRQAFEAGQFGEQLLELLDGPRPAPVGLTGNEEAADFIARRLGGEG